VDPAVRPPGDRYGAVLLVANASALAGLILVKPPGNCVRRILPGRAGHPGSLTSDAADLSPRTGAGLAAIRDTPAAVVQSAIHHR